jgi:nucleoid DNA-binding protein
MTKTTNGIDEITESIKSSNNCKHISKVDIKSVVKSLLSVIEEKLTDNEEVEFIGYFQFFTRKQKAKEIIMRFGKNKGKKIKVPAKKVPVIKFRPTFKERIAK